MKTWFNCPGLLQSRVDVRHRALRLVYPGKPFQILHDALHPLRSVKGFRQQAARVFQRKIYFQGGALSLHCVQFILGRGRRGNHVLQGGLLYADEPLKPPDVFFERIQVAHDKAHRVIDLVRHACRKLADGRHLFLLQKLRLEHLQIGVCLLKLLL
ncbi:MAG: hypothetical protein FD164_2017, partial [Nitrospirae bacterium]